MPFLKSLEEVEAARTCSAPRCRATSRCRAEGQGGGGSAAARRRPQPHPGQLPIGAAHLCSERPTSSQFSPVASPRAWAGLWRGRTARGAPRLLQACEGIGVSRDDTHIWPMERLGARKPQRTSACCLLQLLSLLATSRASGYQRSSKRDVAMRRRLKRNATQRPRRRAAASRSLSAPSISACSSLPLPGSLDGSHIKAVSTSVNSTANSVASQGAAGPAVHSKKLRRPAGRPLSSFTCVTGSRVGSTGPGRSSTASHVGNAAQAGRGHVLEILVQGAGGGLERRRRPGVAPAGRGVAVEGGRDWCEGTRIHIQARCARSGCMPDKRIIMDCRHSPSCPPNHRRSPALHLRVIHVEDVHAALLNVYPDGVAVLSAGTRGWTGKQRGVRAASGRASGEAGHRGRARRASRLVGGSAEVENMRHARRRRPAWHVPCACLHPPHPSVQADLDQRDGAALLRLRAHVANHKAMGAAAVAWGAGRNEVSAAGAPQAGRREGAIKAERGGRRAVRCGYGRTPGPNHHPALIATHASHKSGQQTECTRGGRGSPEASVGDERAVVAQASTHDGAGGCEHLGHAGAALGPLVPDDHHRALQGGERATAGRQAHC